MCVYKWDALTHFNCLSHIGSEINGLALLLTAYRNMQRKDLREEGKQTYIHCYSTMQYTYIHTYIYQHAHSQNQHSRIKRPVGTKKYLESGEQHILLQKLNENGNITLEKCMYLHILLCIYSTSAPFSSKRIACGTTLLAGWQRRLLVGKRYCL